MLVKLDHFPRDRGENKKYLKPPPRFNHLPTIDFQVRSVTLLGEVKVCNLCPSTIDLMQGAPRQSVFGVQRY